MALKPIEKSYEPPKSFKEWDDGEYQVKGISYTSVDDNGHPILKQQKNGLVARFNFMIVEDGKVVKGPNHGLFLYEFPMLAKAFGTEIDQPPDSSNAYQVSEYLEKFEQLVSDKTGKIYVRDKWVNNIKGMSIDAGYYNWRVVDVYSKNDRGEKSWFVKTWPKGGQSIYIRIAIEIVAGNQGKPTPFKGARITTEVPYGFAYENGEIDWLKNEDGNIILDAKRASAMYAITAESMFDPFEPNNPENVVPYWIQHMGQQSKTLFSKIDTSVSKNGNVFYKVDFLDVEESVLPSEIIATSQTVQPPTVQRDVLSDNDIDVESRKLMFEGISNIVGNSVFVNGELNEHGKKFAGEHLKPLAENGKLAGFKLHLATHSQAASLFVALSSADTLTDDQKQLSTEYQEKIELLLLGLDDKDSKLQVEESPWG